MIKNFTKDLAICAFFVVVLNSNAQNSELLKTFINKNDIAVRSVQKYSVNLTSEADADNVKEFLRLQVATVNAFKSNPQKSADLAYMVRQKCTEFLTLNSKGSLDYLTLSDKEKSFFSSPKQVEKFNSLLKKSELEKINSIDTKDPHLFDGLNTRIN